MKSHVATSPSNRLIDEVNEGIASREIRSRSASMSATPNRIG
jgi:hypothetical protein